MFSPVPPLEARKLELAFKTMPLAHDTAIAVLTTGPLLRKSFLLQ